VAQTTARFGPWLIGALAVLLVTGAVMVVGEPERELLALSFWLKMILIAVAVASVLGLRRAVAGVAGPVIPPATRHAAKLVLLIWILIIFLGRAIAYDVEVWRSLSLVHHA